MWTSFESNERTNIIKALVKVQSELENLTKDTQAFKYKYVKLDKLVDAVKEPLNKNGIFFTQMPLGNGSEVGVRTTLYHTSGEWIATQMLSPIAELQGQNMYQSQGSAITYFRRYSLAAMLGLCDVDDTDAQGKVEKTYAKKITSDDLDF
tara:strand:+ start:2356 stop:2805 length:450 start_codon:yes stop_codon:yes gene_type:complete